MRLIDAQGDYRFGSSSADCAWRRPLRVNDPRFYADAAFGGSVGAGEAYIRGSWSCDDLTALVRILVRNRAALNGLESGLARLRRPLFKLFHSAASQQPARQRAQHRRALRHRQRSLPPDAR